MNNLADFDFGFCGTRRRNNHVDNYIRPTRKRNPDGSFRNVGLTLVLCERTSKEIKGIFGDEVSIGIDPSDMSVAIRGKDRGGDIRVLSGKKDGVCNVSLGGKIAISRYEELFGDAPCAVLSYPNWLMTRDGVDIAVFENEGVR